MRDVSIMGKTSRRIYGGSNIVGGVFVGWTGQGRHIWDRYLNMINVSVLRIGRV